MPVVHISTGAHPDVIHNCGERPRPAHRNHRPGRQIAGNHHELQACKLLTLWIILVDKFGKTKNVRRVAGQGVLQGAGRGHQGRGIARVSAGGDADGAEADQEGKNQHQAGRLQ